MEATCREEMKSGPWAHGFRAPGRSAHVQSLSELGVSGGGHEERGGWSYARYAMEVEFGHQMHDFGHVSDASTSMVPFLAIRHENGHFCKKTTAIVPFRLRTHWWHAT